MLLVMLYDGILLYVVGVISVMLGIRWSSWGYCYVLDVFLLLESLVMFWVYFSFAGAAGVWGSAGVFGVVGVISVMLRIRWSSWRYCYVLDVFLLLESLVMFWVYFSFAGAAGVWGSAGVFGVVGVISVMVWLLGILEVLELL